MAFQTEIQNYTQHFQQQLKSFLKSRQKNSGLLFEAINYSVLNGGKHIRPLLVYCSGDSFGIQHLKLDAIAIAIELIHAYSLIHDDLPAMDNAKLRRGKPSCHIKFGEAEAILAGDALQMLAIEAITSAAYISNRQKVRLIHLLTTAAGAHGMVKGQWLDIAAEGKPLTLEELKKIHYLKTGKLIAACILLPASLTMNLSLETIETFAELLGIAYQVQDDILDVESTTELLGKEQGIDEKLLKSTYPKLMGLNAAKDYLATLQFEILKLFENNNLAHSKLAALVDFIFKRKY